MAALAASSPVLSASAVANTVVRPPSGRGRVAQGISIQRLHAQDLPHRHHSSKATRSARPVAPVAVAADSNNEGRVDWSTWRTTDHLTVGDCMSTGRLICAKPSTTVDEALESLVENRITGMPVVDDEGRLVGVVSDYDLLALDSISGVSSSGPSSSSGLFPEANSTWKAFKEIQKLLIKTRGQVVADVMTPHPHTVPQTMNLDQAARLLIENRHRRLPVVDQSGRLVGLLTRGNVVKAALAMKRAAEKEGGNKA